MQQKSEEILLIDDPNLIQYRTDIEGWCSRDGYYLGKDEQTARLRAYKHKKCERCNSIYENIWAHCPDCRKDQVRERYKKLIGVEWDGKTPIATYDDDLFISDFDELDDYLENSELSNKETLENLMLVICEPRGLSPVSEEIFTEELAEDWSLEEFDSNIKSKLDELNKAINDSQKKVWWPTDKRVIIKNL